MNTNRLHLIDTLRGLSIISMIIYHTVWIMTAFGYGLSFETINGSLCTFWERTICMGFILISGFSFSLGRRHLKNGLITFSLGALITLVTCLIVPDLKIIFGVLTFLGSANLLMIPLDKLLGPKTVDPEGITNRRFCIISSLLCIFLFIFFYKVNKGCLGIGNIFLITIPESIRRGYFMTYLGFMMPGFRSADYFSLLPWIFWYFLGYFLEKLSRGTDLRSITLTKGIPALSFLGRHSLVIYVIHPIVIFATVFLYSVCF